MLTSHAFIDKYPIDPSSEKLILGTIHPANPGRFPLQFFYGSAGTLWKILSDAFPGELNQPITVEGIRQFLERRSISMSDTVRTCKRKRDTAFDEDIIPVELNHSLVDQVKHSSIHTIYFTSGFGKNAAFKLFYQEILGKKITNDIRLNREVIITEPFDRPVKLIILYSPSGAGNIGLAQSKLYKENRAEWVPQGSVRPVYDFKVEYYRRMFGNK